LGECEEHTRNEINGWCYMSWPLNNRQLKRIAKKYFMFDFYDEIYRKQFLVCLKVDDDSADVLNYLDTNLFNGKLKEEDGVDPNNFVLRPYANACTIWCTTPKWGKQIIFQFRDRYPSEHEVAHEAWHAAKEILGGLGHKDESAADEAFAYYVAYIVRKIYEGVRKEASDGKG
jgi:hypothetical protein